MINKKLMNLESKTMKFNWNEMQSKINNQIYIFVSNNFQYIILSNGLLFYFSFRALRIIIIFLIFICYCPSFSAGVICCSSCFPDSNIV